MLTKWKPSYLGLLRWLTMAVTMVKRSVADGLRTKFKEPRISFGCTECTMTTNEIEKGVSPSG